MPFAKQHFTQHCTLEFAREWPNLFPHKQFLLLAPKAMTTEVVTLIASKICSVPNILPEMGAHGFLSKPDLP